MEANRFLLLILEILLPLESLLRLKTSCFLLLLLDSLLPLELLLLLDVLLATTQCHLH